MSVDHEGRARVIFISTDRGSRARERVIRIFPDERSPWPVLRALLAEQHELWIVDHRTSLALSGRLRGVAEARDRRGGARA